MKYMHFDGDPVNYVSFMWNFETCLEGDTDNSRKRTGTLRGMDPELVRDLKNTDTLDGAEQKATVLYERKVDRIRW